MPVLTKAHIWLDNRGEVWIDEANTTPSPTSNIERPGKATQSHLQATLRRVDSQGIATLKPP
jgi:hypothetical protein